jgi:hypothetical protein
MTQMVCFNFQPPLTLGSALFWRIVDWCLREGANEFTLSVYGFDDVQSAQDRFAQIKELLQPYECSAAKPAFRKTHVSYEQEKTPKTHVSFNPEGLKRLREALRGIGFQLAGISFKCDVKADAAWIRAMRANSGTRETIASVRAKLDILDDAMTMPRDAFRERLENFLRQNGFEI